MKNFPGFIEISLDTPPPPTHTHIQIFDHCFKRFPRGNWPGHKYNAAWSKNCDWPRLQSHLYGEITVPIRVWLQGLGNPWALEDHQHALLVHADYVLRSSNWRTPCNNGWSRAPAFACIIERTCFSGTFSKKIWTPDNPGKPGTVGNYERIRRTSLELSGSYLGI